MTLLTGLIGWSDDRNPAIVTAQPKPKFGPLLKQLRREAGLTLRGLGRKASIPHSVIAAMESGYRRPNIHTAQRLADALLVRDPTEFLLLAISTTRNQRMLPFARQHDATVLNYLPLCLAHLGINPGSITDTRYGEPPFEGGLGAEGFAEHLAFNPRQRARQRKPVTGRVANSPGLLLRLADGRVVRVSVQVETGR